MQILMGTGSYSNEDWIGLLYPEGTKKTDFLSVYAQHYNAVEVNSSFYAIPGEKAFAGMGKRAAGRLRFSVKLHSLFTHTRKYTEDDVERMLRSPEPLRAEGVLGPFLAQFPYSFHRTPENRRYLWDLAQAMGEQPLALELRHASWDLDEVREGFAEHGLMWVSPDYPPGEGMTRSVLRSSAKTAYLRLHGRNKAQWWDGKDAAERHDYRYSESELAEIADAITALEAETLWVIFNNTTKGHALYNIHILRGQLEARGHPVEGWKPGVGLFDSLE